VGSPRPLPAVLFARFPARHRRWRSRSPTRASCTSRHRRFQASRRRRRFRQPSPPQIRRLSAARGDGAYQCRHSAHRFFGHPACSMRPDLPDPVTRPQRLAGPPSYRRRWITRCSSPPPLCRDSCGGFGIGLSGAAALSATELLPSPRPPATWSNPRPPRHRWITIPPPVPGAHPAKEDHHPAAGWITLRPPLSRIVGSVAVCGEVDVKSPSSQCRPQAKLRRL